METLLLIKNGRVIDPANGIDQTCDVLIKGNRIEKVGQVSEDSKHKTQDCKIIDATDRLVTPGLIDMHVHFREPGDEEEETIASGSEAAVAAGFTSVVTPSVRVKPSKRKPVMAVVLVSLAIIGLKDLGSVVVLKISVPPYLADRPFSF